MPSDQDAFLASCLRNCLEKPQIDFGKVATETGLSVGGAKNKYRDIMKKLADPLTNVSSKSDKNEKKAPAAKAKAKPVKSTTTASNASKPSNKRKASAITKDEEIANTSDMSSEEDGAESTDLETPPNKKQRASTRPTIAAKSAKDAIIKPAQKAKKSEETVVSDESFSDDNIDNMVFDVAQPVASKNAKNAKPTEKPKQKDQIAGTGKKAGTVTGGNAKGKATVNGKKTAIKKTSDEEDPEMEGQGKLDEDIISSEDEEQKPAITKRMAPAAATKHKGKAATGARGKKSKAAEAETKSTAITVASAAVDVYESPASDTETDTALPEIRAKSKGTSSHAKKPSTASKASTTSVTSGYVISAKGEKKKVEVLVPPRVSNPSQAAKTLDLPETSEDKAEGEKEYTRNKEVEAEEVESNDEYSGGEGVKTREVGQRDQSKQLGEVLGDLSEVSTEILLEKI